MQSSIQHKNYTPMFDMVPYCQVPRCPPLLYGAVLSGSAMSTLAIWCRVVRFRVVHPCDMVPHCHFSRCPPLLYGAALSSLAMSALTISMVSRCPVPRFQSPHCGPKVHSFGQWADCAALPVANATHYATLNCKPLFWFPCMDL